MQKLIEEIWVDCTQEDLIVGDTYRISLNGLGWQIRKYTAEAEAPDPIMVTVSLDKTNCAVGDTVNYDITFSESITVPYIVPISVSDRNGNHVTNIGCTVTDGSATGLFAIERAGDFTVTDEAINFHHTVIEAPLKLTNQPWLRVYQ